MTDCTLETVYCTVQQQLVLYRVSTRAPYNPIVALWLHCTWKCNHGGKFNRWVHYCSKVVQFTLSTSVPVPVWNKSKKWPPWRSLRDGFWCWSKKEGHFVQCACASGVIVPVASTYPKGRRWLPFIYNSNWLDIIDLILHPLSLLIMPPKKKEAEKPSPLLGRFGTSLKCGIVGLPNVGWVKPHWFPSMQMKTVAPIIGY